MAKGLGFSGHKCYCVMGKSMFKERKEVKRKLSLFRDCTYSNMNGNSAPKNKKREEKRALFYCSTVV